MNPIDPTTPHGRALVEALTALEIDALVDLTLRYGEYETRVAQALMRYVAEELAQALMGTLSPALDRAIEQARHTAKEAT